MEITKESEAGGGDGFKMPTLPPFNTKPVPVADIKGKDINIEGQNVEETSKVEDKKEKVADDTPAVTPPSPSYQYQEPSWGGLPDKQYSLEVLKNGTIVDCFKLEGKSFFTVGRLPICDVPFEHPSLSRFHAILQFREKPSPEKPVGFYLYDLDSTHGTQHNKRKCFPRTFYRLRVGHMIKFGGSTRTVILQGPDEDQEEETEESVTELKAKAAEKAQKKAEEEERLKNLAEEAERDEAEREYNKGVSWGMDDDAEEFPDMEKNPFAELANNENLYIEDPKKCLKNWFDREGFDLEYKVEEKGFGQFYCRIDLPVDGQPNFAEAEVKGKKKESQVQAALEACRVLDRLGLLKQSQQTRMERRVKKWEDDDFYDSDEDEFLDRTGTIEQKRLKRMKLAGKTSDTIETYESLTKKLEDTDKEQADLEKKLDELLKQRSLAETSGEAKDLDSYMAQLKKVDAGDNKENLSKVKLRMKELTAERERLVKLINIAKPTHMPELKNPQESAPSKPKAGILIGKLGSRGIKGVKSVSKSSISKPIVVPAERTKVLEAFLQEDEERSKKMKLSVDNDDHDDEIKPIGYEVQKPTEPVKKARIGDTSINKLNNKPEPKSERKLGPFIPDNFKQAVESEDRHDDVKNQPSLDVSESVMSTETDELPQDDVTDENQTIKKKRGDRGAKRKHIKPEDNAEEEESYYKVGMDEKYDVWLPPQNQSGDGKTSLNEKLGY